MRKIKSSDEIKRIEAVVKRIDFVYKFARDYIAPGRSEMGLFSEINKAIFDKYGVFDFGEKPNVFGDYVSGERTLAIGGPPLGGNSGN